MSEIRHLLRDKIRSKGVISFARFMELALYCPEYGFYEREPDTIGRGGHFYTSAAVGPLFGELLAFHFSNLLGSLQKAESAVLMEAGAHNGRLAVDILNWLRHHQAGLYESITYTIIEKSRRRRHWQSELLRDHIDRVRWVDELGEGTAHAHPGPAVIFANELLDAFPAHKLEWRAASGKWVEWGVGMNAPGNFVWSELPEPDPGVISMLPAPDQAGRLPDRYVIEVSPSAVQWWRDAAKRLEQGWLITFDYGMTEEDRLAPERTEGTLRAYHHHQIHKDVLAGPGEQDITAHVDFCAIQRAGEDEGLRTAALLPQGRYLERIVAECIGAGVAWDPGRLRQLKTLTHPDHLGAAFKVLAQTRAKN